MAKIRSITLQQNDDGNYSVINFTNTSQLSIGQVVENSRLAYWAGLPDVRFKVVAAPAEKQDDLDEDNQQSVSCVRASAEFEVNTTPVTAGIRKMAAEFDRIMFDNAPERGWANERGLDMALQSEIVDAKDTVSIKAKIQRDGAICLMRRECFRDLNLDPDRSGELKARADALNALKDFVSTVQPF